MMNVHLEKKNILDSVLLFETYISYPNCTSCMCCRTLLSTEPISYHIRASGCQLRQSTAVISSVNSHYQFIGNVYMPANFLEFQRVKLLAKPQFTGFFRDILRARIFLENG